MRDICVQCSVFLTCFKNERCVEVMSGDEPYQLWSGDVWKCPRCGVELLSGFGREPLADHGQDPVRYASMRAFEAARGPIVRVTDQ